MDVAKKATPLVVTTRKRLDTRARHERLKEWWNSED